MLTIILSIVIGVESFLLFGAVYHSVLMMLKLDSIGLPYATFHKTDFTRISKDGSRWSGHEYKDGDHIIRINVFAEKPDA